MESSETPVPIYRTQRCLKVRPRERAFKQFKSPVLNVLIGDWRLRKYSGQLPASRRDVPDSGPDKVALQQVFLQTLRFSPSTTFHRSSSVPSHSDLLITEGKA